MSTLPIFIRQRILSLSDFYPAVIIFGAFVALIFFVLPRQIRKYRSKSAHELPDKKPSFVYFPKYVVNYNFDNISKIEDKNTDFIQNKLSELGFRRVDTQPLRFRRGIKYGYISAKVTQINVDFRLPITQKYQFEISYGWIAFFDTGDLWKVASKIKSCLEND